MDKTDRLEPVLTEKTSQLEIINSQKTHKEILELEVNISQKSVDNLLDIIQKDLFAKKNIALNSLDEIVQSLCLGAVRSLRKCFEISI